MPEMHLEYSMQVKNQFESLIDEGVGDNLGGNERHTNRNSRKNFT